MRGVAGVGCALKLRAREEITELLLHPARGLRLNERASEQVTTGKIDRHLAQARVHTAE